jgi:hypothetical protein
MISTIPHSRLNKGLNPHIAAITPAQLQLEKELMIIHHIPLIFSADFAGIMYVHRPA